MLSFSRYLTRFAMARRFSKDSSGTTIVEFAMVLPLFLLVLGVILESGLMMFTEYVLQTSVQEAARLVRTGQAQQAQMTAAQFKTAVCKIAKVIIACESKVTVYMKASTTFTTLSSSASSAMTVGPKPDGTTDAVTFQCGSPNQAVALIATYDWDFTIPFFMKYFGNLKSNNTRRMAGYAMFKNEPFPSAAANACS
jgi:Flp pilus assembly protein TadG